MITKGTSKALPDMFVSVYCPRARAFKFARHGGWFGTECLHCRQLNHLTETSWILRKCG